MIYFDNSATTYYKPKTVINAVANTMEFLSANPGRSGHKLSLNAGMLVYKTREKLANFFNIDNPSNVVFTSGCTSALNHAILGTVKKGGHVITTVYEHNSVIRPLSELAKNNIISLSVVKPDTNGNITTEIISNYVRHNTYMIVTNHISNVTGNIINTNKIGDFCKKNGFLYCVDGAQSVGYHDINMIKDNINLLAIAPHKGLHAPQGIGALIINTDKQISPILFGGTGTESENPFQPTVLPESLESGTLPTPLIAGLNRAIDWTNNNKTYMQKQISSTTKYIYESLTKIPTITLYNNPSTLNGIVSFNIKNKYSSDVTDILSEKYNICARGGLHCAPLIHEHLKTIQQGIVRISPGIENTYDDTVALLNAIEEISKL